MTDGIEGGRTTPPAPQAASGPLPAPVSLRQAFALCQLAGNASLALQLLLVVLQGLVPLLGLFAMQWLIDAVAAGAAGPAADCTAAFPAVLQATALAAGLAVVGNLVRSAGALLAETHGRQLADAIAGRLQQQVARLDLAAFDRPSFHDLLQRASAEAAHRPVRLVQDLAGVATALVSMLAMGSVLLLVQPWLPLLVAAAAAPIAVARTRQARRRFRWQEQHVPEQRELGYLGAVLTGRATAKDLRALDLGTPFGTRLQRLRAQLAGSLGELARRRALADLGVHTLASLAMFGAYLYLGHLALLGVLSIGGLVLHAQAVQRAQNGMRDLLGGWTAIGEDRLFLRPLVDLLALQPALRAQPPVVELPRGAPGLAAQGLGFQYPESPTASLHDVSFTIAPGERIAIVGSNGSGKSTLVKLLCRLYDPTTGHLAAHGTDLRHLEPTHWRRRIAVLFQDAHGFELTLRENLQLGSEPAAASDARLWQALATVGLDARVRSLPQGLGTPLSRRLAGGVEWSGGELRRLLLARALLQDADLLLLDEPFAQLDGVAAERLAEALRQRDRAQTVVVVDHRTAAVHCVDRVLLLERGRVVAAGAPADLAAQEPRFRALFPEW